MYKANRFIMEELPHSRQLRDGFPWLTFGADLESEYRRANLDENLRFIRVNLCLGIAATAAFGLVGGMLLDAGANRVSSIMRWWVIAPLFLGALGASLAPRRHRFYAPAVFAAGTVLGLSAAAMVLAAQAAGFSLMFPGLLMTTIFIYFMGGLMFYHALAANVLVALAYLVAGTLLQLPAGEFGYNVLSIVIELPKTMLTGTNGKKIGVWCTTSK